MDEIATNVSLTYRISKTLNAASGDSDHAPAVIVLNDQGGAMMDTHENVTMTLRAQEHGHQPVVLFIGGTVSNASITDGDKASTMLARAGTGGGNEPIILAERDNKYILRRLTPTECARLQGFPDWWTDGVSGSDSAKYKMWGNGIALPCAADVLGRIAKELIRAENNNQEEEK